MSTNRNIFIQILLLFCIVANGQNDTILIAYPSLSNDVSLNNELILLQQNKLGIIQETENGIGLILANSIGNILERQEYFNLKGYELTQGCYLFESDTGFVFLTNANKGVSTFLLSVGLSKTFENPMILDSIEIQGGARGVLTKWKKNINSGNWESIGITFNNGLSEYGLYVEISEKYNFKRTKFIPINSVSTVINEFVWFPDSKIYLAADMWGEEIVLDSNINLISKAEFDFNFDYNNTTYTANFDPKSCCFKSDSSIIDCYSMTDLFSDTPYRNSIMTLKVVNDSIRLDTVYPINITGTTSVDQFSDMRKDTEGNFIVAGIDNFTINLSVTLPNIIKVVKVSPNYEILWTLEYSDHSSYDIWDLEIDDEGTIYIVGMAQNIINDHLRYGFLLKIYKNGNFTVSNLDIPKEESVTIYPNPCGNFVSLKGSSSSQIVLKVTNTLGQLVLAKEIMIDERIDITNLPFGGYYYLLSDKSGRLLKAGKLLKN